MPTISFKQIYDGAKNVIDKNVPSARISKLSTVGIEIINRLIGKTNDEKVRNIDIYYNGERIAANNVKKTYVQFMSRLCRNDNKFSKLLEAGWIFGEAERSTSRDDYGETGRSGAYIYTNCNIDLLIVKFVKAVIDTGEEQKLNDFYFEIEFTKQGNLANMLFQDEWWPSLTEYNPNLTKDDWKKYILEVELPNHPSPMKMLKGMMELGGEASCKQLSETYGGHPSAYSGCAMNLGRRVKKHFGLKECMDGDQERYFPFPFVGKYRGGSQDNYLYRIRTELQEALMEIDLSGIDPNYGGGEEQLSTKEILQHISTYIAAKGFEFDEGLVKNYYLSLKTKPFVILAGTSGTGKTRLVRLFAESIGATAENGRYKLVSVRPDWSDSSDLFGHVNLQGEFVPGAIIEFIKTASGDLEHPYFLCLDEMNLARVEYYLSDFLSVIETRKWGDDRIQTDIITLDKAADEEYPDLSLPENLYVIGTVNMDETTFPFSKKVLDRANTIEFSYVDLVPDFEDMVTDCETVVENNEFLKTKYITLKSDIDKTEREFVRKISIELQAINEILQDANAHVGYRVRDEIVFYMLNNEKAKLLSETEALDNEIMQKILPRIQGSGKGVEELLVNLFKKFAGDYSGISQDRKWKQMKTYIKDRGCVYKKSAEKICYMMRRFEEDGFTSYWL